VSDQPTGATLGSLLAQMLSLAQTGKQGGFETQKHSGKAKKDGHKARGPGETGGRAGFRNTARPAKTAQAHKRNTYVSRILFFLFFSAFLGRFPARGLRKQGKQFENRGNVFSEGGGGGPGGFFCFLFFRLFLLRCVTERRLTARRARETARNTF
jgi:hypothetical protein